MSRILKVNSACPYESLSKGFVEVPYIKLQGKWIERLGFKYGSRFEVLESAGEIIIRLVKEDGKNHVKG